MLLHTVEHLSLWYECASLGISPTVGLLGLEIDWFPVFWETVILISKVAVQVCIPPITEEGSPYSYLLQHQIKIINESLPFVLFNDSSTYWACPILSIFASASLLCMDLFCLHSFLFVLTIKNLEFFLKLPSPLTMDLPYYIYFIYTSLWPILSW